MKKEITRFTFKTERPTGHYASFYSDAHYIKLKRKQVGTIEDQAPHKIRLQVVKDGVKFKDTNSNCDWKWITLTREFESVQAAKDWLNQSAEKVVTQFPLKQLD